MPGAKKTFKARMLELLEKMDDEDSPASPAVAVDINSARIVEIANPESAVKGTAVQVDEAQAGPSRPPGQKYKFGRRSNMDFPKGL